MVNNTEATITSEAIKVPKTEKNAKSVQEDTTTRDCKICSKKFNSLKEALSHELEHFKITETPGNDQPQVPTKNAKKKRKRQKKSLRLNNEGDCDFKQAVISALALCPDGQELNLLCKLFQPNPNNLACVYERIHADLEHELSTAGTWKIFPFGSTITGMAFKTSDIDFFIQSEDDPAAGNNFKTVKKALYGSQMFSNIVPIPRARVPLFKCTHNMTGYNLDISFSSKIGVFNSQFIAKVFALDSRIHPLMLIVKIWAKTWELKRVGRFTNYSLILFVIFYLQQCRPPILPPVKSLQEGVAPMLVDGINVVCNVGNRNPSRNKQNIKQLVQGLFKFYSEYDFQKNIISPYLGRSIPRQDFESGKFQFPDYVKQLKSLQAKDPEGIKKFGEIVSTPIKLDSIIVLQDMFCLNQGKADTINEMVFTAFQKQLAHAHKICSDPSTINQSASQLLMRLFYEPIEGIQPNINNQDISNSKAAHDYKPGANASVCKFSPIEAELLYVRTHLRRTQPNQSFDKTEINKFWAEKIVEFTSEMLTNMYGIRMNSLKGNNVKKSARGPGQSDVHYNKYSINCEIRAVADVWSARKVDAKKGYAVLLQEQDALTKKLLPERKTSMPVNIHCKMALRPEPDFTSLILTLDDLAPKASKTGHLKTFFTNLTSRMRLYYKAYFERLTRECKI